MVSYTSEDKAVERPLLQYASEVGWKLLTPEHALTLRKGEGGLFLYPVLREALIRLNDGLITNENVDEVIQKIESVRNSIEGNREILGWLRGQRTVYDAREKRNLTVRLIDFGDDAIDVSGVIEDIDVLFKAFFEKMMQAKSAYLPSLGSSGDDKAIEAVDAFMNKENREEFFKFYKQTESLYEILSPAAELRDSVDDFRKWASCSTKGTVTFSKSLLTQPQGFQTYVIVHELLHLKVPNHGKLFKSLLSAHVPNWARYKKGRH